MSLRFVMEGLVPGNEKKLLLLLTKKKKKKKQDLSQLIKHKAEKKEYLEEAIVMDIFIQLCMAVDYCHSLRIMHRDLKAGNVFITRKNVVKLGDFGKTKSSASALAKLIRLQELRKCWGRK